MSSPKEDSDDKDKTETVFHDESPPEAEGGGEHHLELKEESSSTMQKLTEGSTSVKDTRKARLDRLKELHLRRVRGISLHMNQLKSTFEQTQNEARKLNHVEVVEEDKRNKLPTNWEARRRKIEWELQEEEAKKVTVLQGSN